MFSMFFNVFFFQTDTRHFGYELMTWGMWYALTYIYSAGCKPCRLTGRGKFHTEREEEGEASETSSFSPFIILFKSKVLFQSSMMFSLSKTRKYYKRIYFHQCLCSCRHVWRAGMWALNDHWIHLGLQAWSCSTSCCLRTLFSPTLPLSGSDVVATKSSRGLAGLTLDHWSVATRLHYPWRHNPRGILKL